MHDETRWVSPLRVYRAATYALRWRFWLAVLFCVGVAPGAVIAQAQQPSPLQEWLSPPVVIALLSALIAVGSTIQDVRAVKKKQEQGDEVYARQDVIAVQHAAILSSVEGVRDEVRALAARFQGYFPEMNAEINSVQHDVVTLGKEVAALSGAVKKGAA